MTNKKNTGHWTERSVKDYLHRIASDFIAQIESRMESAGIRQSDLAKALGVTEGRVSQIINNPGNLTLNMIIKYSRALGMKVAVVAYDDGDQSNNRGPVNADVFRISWERMGKPGDFWSIREQQEASSIQSLSLPSQEPAVTRERREPIYAELIGVSGPTLEATEIPGGFGKDVH